MYTLDEINVILSDLDACGHGGRGCAACSRSENGRYKSTKACFGLEADAAAVIRWLLEEFHRYAGEQTQLGGEVDANA